jgi:hemerythrin superfamily protein
LACFEAPFRLGIGALGEAASPLATLAGDGKGVLVNAIDLLKKDHRTFEKLCAELESTTERAVKTRQELFARLKDELVEHEEIEEEIVYPALREHREAKEIVLEGYEEHHVVDLIVGEMEGIDVSDEVWTAKFSVMKENLAHHIEEEEGEMFPQAEKLLTSDELESLGARIQERKKAG